MEGQIIMQIETSRISKIASNQKVICSHLSDSVALAMSSGAEFNAQKADLKQQLENWHANGKSGNKPLKFEEWCALHESETCVSKRTHSNYMNLDTNQELLKNTQSSAYFSSIDTALKYISETKKQLKLDSQTETEKRADEVKAEKRAEKATEKAVTKAKETLKEAGVTCETPVESTAPLDFSKKAREPIVRTVSKEEFKERISDYIPPKTQSRIEENMEVIPDFVETIYMGARETVSAEMDKLSKADNSKVLNATMKIAQAQKAAFTTMLKNAPSYFKAAEQKHKEAAQKLKKKTKELTVENLVTPTGSMTTEEFKLIRSCLHPDREATKERKKKAYLIFERVTAVSYKR